MTSHGARRGGPSASWRSVTASAMVGSSSSGTRTWATSAQYCRGPYSCRGTAQGVSAMSETAQSYAHGTSAVPLIGQTIGENLAATVARFPDHEALVVPFQGVRLTYAELDAAVDELARGLLAAGIEKGDRVGIWSPNCAEWVLVQYATARVGAILVNLNPAYRTHEVAYALNQSGCRLLVAAQSFKTSDYVAMVAEVRPDGPCARAGGLPRHAGVGRARRPPAPRSTRPRCEARSDEPAVRRPDQHPVHERHDGLPEGRHAVAPQHPQQRLLRRRGLPLRRAGPRVHPRALLPLLRHGARATSACTTHGATMVVPAPAFDPEATLRTVQDERCTSLYGVPTMFIAELAHPDFHRFDLSSLRTGIMAGSPCPVEVMKQCVSAMHMEEVTICYGMTETSPVSTQTGADDPLDKRVSSVGRVHPHVEVKVVDPDSGRVVPRGASGELCTRGLLGDARLLGRAGEDGRGHRRGRLDAHRRPGHDGRRRLPEHRRAHQGHDHPGRRERVPARDRGVPLHPPRHRRRAGDRRAGRALRRGDHGVGEDARRRATLDRRGGAGVLRGSDRPLQGPALRAGHRRVPDDGHRQGPEVQDARGGHRRCSASRTPPGSRPRERRPRATEAERSAPRA